MQAVILAGGKGTRLQQRLGGLPKPMAGLAGKPLIGHQVELLRRTGFQDVVTMLGYRADAIIDYLGDGTEAGLRIRHVVETTPLGSGGSVLAVLEDLDERFAVIYGDTVLNVDLARFWKAHAASGADVTLFLHPNDHPQDSDLVEIDEDGWVSAFHPYPHPEGRFYRNLVNAALYMVEKKALEQAREAIRTEGLGDVLDFAKHIFPSMLKRGHRIKGYVSREYIKDAGTPERLDRATGDFASGKIQRGSLATAAPAVFLDRDGTINREVNRVKAPGELELLPGVGKAIGKLNKAGLPVVVITNQPVIARGDCTVEGLREIHNKMDALLGQDHAFVDALYYCPHHPDKGFPGEIPELKMECNCRKPRAGLVEQAVKEMNLDPRQSWFIGDSVADMKTAAAAGARAILVETGHIQAGDPIDVPVDFRCPSLPEAIDFVLHHQQQS